VAPRVVLNTNVLVAALRSNREASFRLLSEVDSGRFEVCLSVPLVLDYLCSVARRQSIFFLWRPQLRDPGDDMVLELAVAAGCRFIVTFNTRDFGPARSFSQRVLTPREFLQTIGVIQ
jgi:predicted nucleic acid-binding protein